MIIVYKTIVYMADKTFGKTLREVREERGLSQEALAKAAGLHWTYISQIERGLKSPTLKSLGQMARALGVPGWELLKRADI